MAEENVNVAFNLLGNTSSFVSALDKAATAAQFVGGRISSSFGEIQKTFASAFGTALPVTQIEAMQGALEKFSVATTSVSQLDLLRRKIAEIGLALSNLGKAPAGPKQLEQFQSILRQIRQIGTRVEITNPVLKEQTANFLRLGEVASVALKETISEQKASGVSAQNLGDKWKNLGNILAQLKSAATAYGMAARTEASETRAAQTEATAQLKTGLKEIKTYQTQVTDGGKIQLKIQQMGASAILEESEVISSALLPKLQAANRAKKEYLKLSQQQAALIPSRAIESTIVKVRELTGETISSSQAAKLLGTSGESAFRRYTAAVEVAEASSRPLIRTLHGVGGTLRNLGFQTQIFGTVAYYTFQRVAEESSKYVDAIRTLSQETGSSYQVSQQLIVAFQQVGISGESATKSLRFLSDSVQKAKEGGKAAVKNFQELGLSVSDLTQHSGDVVGLMGLVADRLNAIHDPIQRAALASRLFGSSIGNASKILVLFQNGAKGLEDRMKSMTVLTDAQVNSAKKARDLWANMETDFEQLATVIMADAEPAIQAISHDIDTLVKFVENHPEFIKFITGKIVSAAPWAVLGGTIAGLAGTLLTTTTAVLPLVRGLRIMAVAMKDVAAAEVLATGATSTNAWVNLGKTISVVGTILLGTPLGAILTVLGATAGVLEVATVLWKDHSQKIEDANIAYGKADAVTNKFNQDLRLQKDAFYDSKDAVTESTDAVKAYGIKVKDVKDQAEQLKDTITPTFWQNLNPFSSTNKAVGKEFGKLSFFQRMLPTAPLVAITNAFKHLAEKIKESAKNLVFFHDQIQKAAAVEREAVLRESAQGIPGIVSPEEMLAQNKASLEVVEEGAKTREEHLKRLLYEQKISEDQYNQDVLATEKARISEENTLLEQQKTIIDTESAQLIITKKVAAEQILEIDKKIFDNKKSLIDKTITFEKKLNEEEVTYLTDQLNLEQKIAETKISNVEQEASLAKESRGLEYDQKRFDLEERIKEIQREETRGILDKTDAEQQIILLKFREKQLDEQMKLAEDQITIQLNQQNEADEKSLALIVQKHMALVQTQLDQTKDKDIQIKLEDKLFDLKEKLFNITMKIKKDEFDISKAKLDQYENQNLLNDALQDTIDKENQLTGTSGAPTGKASSTGASSGGGGGASSKSGGGMFDFGTVPGGVGVSNALSAIAGIFTGGATKNLSSPLTQPRADVLQSAGMPGYGAFAEAGGLGVLPAYSPKMAASMGSHVLVGQEKMTQMMNAALGVKPLPTTEKPGIHGPVTININGVQSKGGKGVMGAAQKLIDTVEQSLGDLLNSGSMSPLGGH